MHTSPQFWEQLGRAMAAFGFLEKVLKGAKKMLGRFWAANFLITRKNTGLQPKKIRMQQLGILTS
jgi:hypothetical protein